MSWRNILRCVLRNFTSSEYRRHETEKEALIIEKEKENVYNLYLYYQQWDFQNEIFQNRKTAVGSKNPKSQHLRFAFEMQKVLRLPANAFLRNIKFV